MTKRTPLPRYDSEMHKELMILRDWNKYYERALRMIAAPVPVEALCDRSFVAMGKVFAERVLIAQRSLRGEPLPEQKKLDYPEDQKGEQSSEI